jgi:hypothetical protein
MPDEPTPPTPEQQAAELQLQFETNLVLAAKSATGPIDDSDTTNWLAVASAVIDRYEMMMGGARVPFRTEAPPANLIQMPGTAPSAIAITVPIDLASIMPGTVAGWTLQVFGKGSGGPFANTEFDFVFSNGTVANHNIVNFADLAIAIVMRQQFDVAHQAKPEQKEGEDAH